MQRGIFISLILDVRLIMERVNWKIFLPRGMASNGISVNRGGPRLFTLPGKKAGTAEIDICSIAAILEDSLSLADLDAKALTLFRSFSSLT